MKRPRLKLPDLYLIDSQKLLREVDRIRVLALAVPTSAETHAPLLSVIEALWHLRRDMEDILKVQAAIHHSFAQKADDLAEANRPPQIGLRIVQIRAQFEKEFQETPALKALQKQYPDALTPEARKW